MVIMLTGVAVLGLLAGSLASFFRLGQGGAPGDDTADGDASGSPPDSATALGALVAEVASLRQQVALLSERIADMGDPASQLSPAPRQDEP